MAGLKPRKSIQFKIERLIILAIILTVVFIGGIGLISAQKIIDANTTQYIAARADAEKASLDEELGPVEQSVTSLARILTNDLGSVTDLSDDASVEAFMDQEKDTILDIANTTDGAVAFYVRFNPDYASPTSGIFYQRSDLDVATFVPLEPTDISLYDEDDTEHVGWYYAVKDAKQAVWMAPYYNENIDVYMISYIAPLFKNDRFIGLVGMDINFDYLTSKVGDISIYDTGYAYLATTDGTVYWHPQLAIGDKVENNSKYERISRRLTNGMYLFLEAPKSEINHERTKLVLQIILFSLGIILIFTVVTLVTTRSMVLPLQKLNEAAKNMAKGDEYDQIPVSTDDEIGELTDSFNLMSNHLKEYSEYIRMLAYKDGLTGVRNRMAFEKEESELTAEVLSTPGLRFAIAVMDVNYLKLTNDTLGHEGGDLLLRNCCRLICRTFSHSPVFRIGGDEFVAILKGEDFERRVELYEQLQNNMQATQSKEALTERLSIACGVAEYKEDVDLTVDDVFRRADSRMYSNKKAMKAGRE